MASDNRQMVVYEYGRNDFEADLDDYSGGEYNSVSYGEWNAIQDYLSDRMSEHVDELIKQAIYNFIETKKEEE